MIAFAIYLALSPLVAWLAGRFIRVGMVDLQPQHAPATSEFCPLSGLPIDWMRAMVDDAERQCATEERT